jgi:hypothetical protein
VLKQYDSLKIAFSQHNDLPTLCTLRNDVTLPTPALEYKDVLLGLLW